MMHAVLFLCLLLLFPPGAVRILVLPVRLTAVLTRTVLRLDDWYAVAHGHYWLQLVVAGSAPVVP